MPVEWSPEAEIDLNTLFHYNEEREETGDLAEGETVAIDEAIRARAANLVPTEGHGDGRWIGRRVELPPGYFIFFVNDGDTIQI